MCTCTSRDPRTLGLQNWGGDKGKPSFKPDVCSDSGRTHAAGGRGGGTFLTWEVTLWCYSGASVFLQTGNSCLGTLNCPLVLVKAWASYHFKDVWSLFPSRVGAICTGEVLDIYQGEC